MKQNILATILVLVFSAPAWAQPAQQVDFFANTPPPVQTNPISTQVVGPSGSRDLYYWIVANYPIGKSFPAGPALVHRAPDTMTGINYVQVSWSAAPGAVSYDVLRTTTQTFPTGTATIAAITGLLAPLYINNTDVLVPYTLTVAPGTVGYMRLNNKDYATPRYDIDPATVQNLNIQNLQVSGVPIATILAMLVPVGGAVGGASALTTGDVGRLTNVAAAGILGVTKLSCTLGVCTVYDDTAVTGSSTLVVRSGAGQAATNLQEWKDAAGAVLTFIDASGFIRSSRFGTGDELSTNLGNLNLGNAKAVKWSSDSTWFNTSDLGLSRTSAGRAQFNNGTAGKWSGLDVGSLYVNALATPGAPTVTPTCPDGACASTWTYTCTALAGDGTTTVPGASASTAVNNATLDATHYNTVTCPAVTGASYNTIRRTVSGGTPASVGRLTGCTSTAYGTACVDVGLVGDASAAPAANTTGQLLWSPDGGASIGNGSSADPAGVFAKVKFQTRQDGYYAFQYRGGLQAIADGLFQFYDYAGTTTETIGVGGTIPAWRKYTVAYTNASFKLAGTTETVALFTLPANGVIQGIRLKHSQAFAGTAVTSVTCSVGDGTYAIAYSPAFDVFQATGATVQYWDGGAYSSTSASQTVTLSCIANTNFGDGANTVLTAGSLDVHVFWAVLP